MVSKIHFHYKGTFQIYMFFSKKSGISYGIYFSAEVNKFGRFCLNFILIFYDHTNMICIVCIIIDKDNSTWNIVIQKIQTKSLKMIPMGKKKGINFPT